MFHVLNSIALVIGWVVLALLAVALLFFGRAVWRGILESIDYHRWVIAMAKQTNAPPKPGYKARLIKSFLWHILEYLNGVPAETIAIRLNGGIWQGRGNWRLPDKTEGPRYTKPTF